MLLALGAPAAAQPAPADAATPDVREHLASVRRLMTGRENEPAGTVFKNLQVLGDAPASRIPLLMETAFAKALGVDCTHCHTPGEWERDDKEPKRIAREMWTMMLETTARVKKLVPDAAVNCTTCHRGEVKPALNLPASRR